jgi:hypothetical protein
MMTMMMMVCATITYYCARSMYQDTTRADSLLLEAEVVVQCDGSFDYNHLSESIRVVIIVVSSPLLPSSTSHKCNIMFCRGPLDVE